MIPWAYRLKNWLDEDARTLRQQQRDFVKICRAGQLLARAMDQASHGTKIILIGEHIIQPFKETSHNIRTYLQAISEAKDNKEKLQRITEAINKGNAIVEKEVGPWG